MTVQSTETSTNDAFSIEDNMSCPIWTALLRAALPLPPLVEHCWTTWPAAGSGMELPHGICACNTETLPV
eukprot:2993878-Amphidinium_carterae.1